MTRKISDKYFVRKTYVYFEDSADSQKGLLDTFEPVTTISTNFKNWRTILDLRTCIDCRSKNGKIYKMDEIIYIEPPLHNNCRCDIMPMESIAAGKATKSGNNGADYWLKYFGKLPKNYVSRDESIAFGWRWGKSPAKFIPRKMITMGIYENKNGHLPDLPSRIWHEADINYYEGRRNKHRVLWSNDGLLFVTYDHYETFYEII